MGAGVRVGECGVDIIAAENWRCRWEKSCGVVVVVKCETVTAQTYVYQNKHGSFGRYDRLLARPSRSRCAALAPTLSLGLCPIDLQQIGVGFFTRMLLLYSSACI